MDKLEKAREIINETDKEMARLFAKRMDAVRLVAEYKKSRGMQVEDKKREESIIKRNTRFMADEAYKSYYVNFLRYNMELSKTFQHRLLDGMRVAYSGVPGAFANIAAQKIFPDAVHISCGDFKDAYEAVVNGECDCAILPLENSYNGDVGQVMDLTFFGNLYINGIYDIEVVQHLLGVKGTTIEEIKEITSHPQALGQCSEYIHRHGWKVIPAINTAVAVKEVAEMGRHDIAAIGSDEAAARYNLVRLESHINESNMNTTRFGVFSRIPKITTSEDRQFIMLFTVTNEAGSLGKAVSVIGKYGFNLRALKSRPIKELIWNYYFFVEGEGNISGEDGKAMIDELKVCCKDIKIAGSFEREIIL